MHIVVSGRRLRATTLVCSFVCYAGLCVLGPNFKPRKKYGYATLADSTNPLDYSDLILVLGVWIFGPQNGVHENSSILLHCQHT